MAQIPATEDTDGTDSSHRDTDCTDIGMTTDAQNAQTGEVARARRSRAFARPRRGRLATAALGWGRCVCL